MKIRSETAVDELAYSNYNLDLNACSGNHPILQTLSDYPATFQPYFMTYLIALAYLSLHSYHSSLFNH